MVIIKRGLEWRRRREEAINREEKGTARAVGEKAILVGVKEKGNNYDFEYSFEELHGLVKAAGGTVVASLIQAKDHPHPSTYLGKGKLDELQGILEESQAELVVFDNELTPVQKRNLEDRLECTILDRTLLILDIFAQRARSKEGRLQVELATLEYRLPRLTGKGRELSRLGAGIGTRGAGEQKLELDRRYVRKRIQDIKKQMTGVEKTRSLHRKRRQKADIKEVSLVGYTNAGKSTLFNALCRSGHSSGQGQAEADSRLFQTLDTTTRRIGFPYGPDFLITDTVGFIRNLPHHLVKAFRSTLEEAVHADLILHVIDASDPDYLDKISIVEGVLEGLGADQGRVLQVFTKVDLVPEGMPFFNTGVGVSARTGYRIDTLLRQISLRLHQETKD